MFFGVKFVALHVLVDLVYGACAVRSFNYMPVSFATPAHLLSLRTSEWISMKPDANGGVNCPPIIRRLT
jgi:hypothetical protein